MALTSKIGIARRLILVMLLILSPIANAAEPLHYAFDFRTLNSPDAPAKRYRCPKMVSAMTDMSAMFAFYKPSKTASEVDKGLMAAYVVKMKFVLEAKQGLSTLVSEAINEPSHRLAARLCILKQVRLWAQKDALLGRLDVNTPLGHRQAVLEMMWTGIAFANAYAIAAQIQPVAPEYDAAIKKWFARMNLEIIGEFTPRPRGPKERWLDAPSNQRFWAAAAVASLAAHTGNTAQFDWAMAILDAALDDAQNDGALPLELGRGSRATHYQNFALDALSILVSFADANKRPITEAREEKLRAVAKFAADAFQNPNAIEKRTGFKQDAGGKILVWAPVLAARFRHSNHNLAEQIDALSENMISLPDESCASVCVAFYRAAAAGSVR